MRSINTLLIEFINVECIHLSGKCDSFFGSVHPSFSKLRIRYPVLGAKVLRPIGRLYNTINGYLSLPEDNYPGKLIRGGWSVYQ